jgi:hypothetical protein
VCFRLRGIIFLLFVGLVCGLPYVDKHRLYYTVGDLSSTNRVVILTGAQHEPVKCLGIERRIEMTGSDQLDPVHFLRVDLTKGINPDLIPYLSELK